MPWDFILILVVLGIVIPWRGAARVKALLALPRLETTDRLALYAGTIAFQWVLTGVVVWRCAARGVTAPQLAVAFPDPAKSLAVALLLSAGLALAQYLSLRHMARRPLDPLSMPYQMAAKILPQNLTEAMAFVALACTVALCEEVLFRGFAFTVLQSAFFDSLLVAALGSSVLFGIAHLYQGPRGMALGFVLGLVFALTRIWTGSLGPAIVGHLVTDLVGGLAGPRMLVRARRQSVLACGSASGDDEGRG